MYLLNQTCNVCPNNSVVENNVCVCLSGMFLNASLVCDCISGLVGFNGECVDNCGLLNISNGHCSCVESFFNENKSSCVQ